MRRHIFGPLAMAMGLVLSSPAVGQPSLGYLGLGYYGDACCLASDANGNVYVAGVSNAVYSGPGPLVITKFDRSLRRIYRFTFGAATSDRPEAIAVDSQGGVFVAGWTKSASFPLVHSLGIAPQTRVGTGFLVKVSPAGDQLVFSTLLGGAAADAITSIHAIAVDQGGNVYLTGETAAADFPITVNVYQPGRRAVLPTPQRILAFVTEVSNGGERILFSTLLGDNATPPVGLALAAEPLRRLPPPVRPDHTSHTTVGDAVAVAADGTITVSGSTDNPDYPVTPGAFQSAPTCTGATGFVTRIVAGGSALQWSTLLGGCSHLGRYPEDSYGFNGLSKIALTGDGAVVLVGTTTATDFPVTAGAFQTRFTPHFSDKMNSCVVIAELNSSGTALVFSTYLGGSIATSASALQLDSQGHPWVVGSTTSGDFPWVPHSFSLGVYNYYFVAELAADGSSLLQTQAMPLARGLALDAAGGEVVLSQNKVLRFSAALAPATIVAEVDHYNATPGTNADVATASVVPGAFVRLYGIGLGPAGGLDAQFDSAGKLPTELAGTQVLFDDTPAPLLHTDATEIDAIVPFGVSGKPYIFVEVRNASGVSATLSVGVMPVFPQILRAGSAHDATVLNEDGTVNTPSNPAHPGSMISFWVTGCGLFHAPLVDGTIVAPPLPAVAAPVSVAIEGASTPAHVVYAGAAPGQVSGVLQVNAVIPQGIRGGGAIWRDGVFYYNDHGLFLTVGGILTNTSVFIE